LPPESLTPLAAVLVAKFAAGVVDTGGAPLLANIFANFRKIRNYPNVVFRAWWDMINGKN
jgi:hypothetical protein